MTTVTALAQDIGLARETDYFLMKDQLTEDELGLLYRVREFAETEVLPVVNPYWKRGEFPFELVTELAALNIVGETMVGDGTTPMSAVGSVPKPSPNGRGSSCAPLADRPTNAHSRPPTPSPRKKR
jgi:hypothetical protein